MKDINLFNGIKKSAPPKKKGKSATGGLVLLIVCAVAVGGIYYWLTTQKDATQSEIEAANQQISAAQMTADGGMEAKQNKLASIRSYNAMLSALDENVQSYPKLDAAFLNDMERRMPAGVTVLGLAYQNGVLTLDCAAGDADAPANFADALSKSAYIDAVALKGSLLDVNVLAETGAIRFNFTVECYPKGGVAQ